MEIKFPIGLHPSFNIRLQRELNSFPLEFCNMQHKDVFHSKGDKLSQNCAKHESIKNFWEKTWKLLPQFNFCLSILHQCKLCQLWGTSFTTSSFILYILYLYFSHLISNMIKYQNYSPPNYCIDAKYTPSYSACPSLSPSLSLLSLLPHPTPPHPLSLHVRMKRDSECVAMLCQFQGIYQYHSQTALWVCQWC